MWVLLNDFGISHEQIYKIIFSHNISMYIILVILLIIEPISLAVGFILYENIAGIVKIEDWLGGWIVLDDLASEDGVEVGWLLLFTYRFMRHYILFISL